MARVPLSRLPGWNVVHEDQEIRGLRLQDEAGTTHGLVTDLIVDTEAGEVAAIVLDTGMEIDARDIEIGRDVVFLRRDDDRASSADMSHHVVDRQASVDAPAQRSGEQRSYPQHGAPVRRLVSAVDEPAAQSGSLSRPGAFVEGIYEVRARAEVLEIRKQLRVVEEIHINKQAAEHTEMVRESVRQAHVDVEELPGRTNAST
jgi:hypothetical protein